MGRCFDLFSFYDPDLPELRKIRFRLRADFCGNHFNLHRIRHLCQYLAANDTTHKPSLDHDRRREIHQTRIAGIYRRFSVL